MIDLHTHSTASDGTNTPEEVITIAKEAGLTAVALTDHDTINGLSRAKKRANELNITFIPGIELSTDYEGTEVHILGYYIDVTNPMFVNKLQDFIDSRDARNEKMASLLTEHGYPITMHALRQENPGSVITRAHFAKYLVAHGLVKDMKTVFSRLLGDDCPCYVKREKIDPFEAIRLIKSGGGLAFFAHPILCHMNQERLKRFILELKGHGLTGIEAIYSTNSPGDERNMRAIAKECGLLISGGSDYHGGNKPFIQIGKGTGSLVIPDYLLDNLRDAHQSLL